MSDPDTDRTTGRGITHRGIHAYLYSLGQKPGGLFACVAVPKSAWSKGVTSFVQTQVSHLPLEERFTLLFGEDADRDLTKAIGLLISGPNRPTEPWITWITSALNTHFFQTVPKPIAHFLDLSIHSEDHSYRIGLPYLAPEAIYQKAGVADQTEGVRLQALGLAKLREQLVHDYPMLSAADVARMSHSQSENPSATVGRLKRSRQVFALPLGGSFYYPAIQFDLDTGKPKKIFADLIATFGPQSANPINPIPDTGWTIFIWLTSNCEFLGEKRPIELVDSDPSKVLEAARDEMTPLDF